MNGTPLPFGTLPGETGRPASSTPFEAVLLQAGNN